MKWLYTYSSALLFSSVLRFSQSLGDVSLNSLVVAMVSSTILFMQLALYAETPLQKDSFDCEDIECRLRNEPIRSVTRLSTFLKKIPDSTGKAPSTMKLVELESGIRAVFKAHDYKSTLSGGSSALPDYYCYAELAAYKASCVLGLGLVPPTVLRTIGDKPGSLQLFIEPSMKTTRSNKDRVHEKNKSDAAVFCFVMGQWDLHEGNQILVEDENEIVSMLLIDNATIKHVQKVRYGNHAFIKKAERKGVTEDSKKKAMEEPFPFKSTKTMSKGTMHSFRRLLANYFKPGEARKVLNNKRTPYAEWGAAFWLQQSRYKKQSPAYTTTYYRSTLQALEALDHAVVSDIWKEGIEVNEKFTVLVDLILERREQVLEAAYSQGAEIIEDLDPVKKIVPPQKNTKKKAKKQMLNKQAAQLPKKDAQETPKLDAS